MKRLRMAVAQINVSVGDFAGNARKILEYVERARALRVDVLAFPELALPGYPPEDLLLKPRFVEENQRWLERVAAGIRGLVAVVGCLDRREDLFNAAAVLCDGRVAAVAHKQFLPNYGVFDENRYFQEGTGPLVFRYRGANIGVNICEDIWYANGPTRVQALAGDAEVVINLSSSPFHAGKGADRETMLRTRATDNAVFVVYANLVGGQDELVFDGNSLVIDAEGTVLARGLPFEEDLVVCDLDLGQLFNQRLHDPRRRKEKLEAREAERLVFVDLDGPAGPAVPPDEGEKPPLPARSVPRLDEEAEVYAALVLGCRDYVRKNGFAKVVVGLSGGIDSALTAVVAVDALGAESVVGLRMPSPFSSEGSLRDAAELADNLGIVYYTIPIDGIFAAYRQALAPVFGDLPFDVTEENIQARIRGNLLMALSNKFGWLVLPTGNKSELGVGYATLYGDMAGGFSLLKDVPKTLVYRLAAYRNRLGPRPVIPQAVFEKPPSAELRPDQKDEDTLPPYAVLDPILRLYVERDLDVDAIVARGFPEETVRRVARMVDRNEYKRRQAAPGPKITPRAFGRDRRYPITNRFQG